VDVFRSGVVALVLYNDVFHVVQRCYHWLRRATMALRAPLPRCATAEMSSKRTRKKKLIGLSFVIQHQIH
jgi:hypothetical protein